MQTGGPLKSSLKKDKRPKSGSARETISPASATIGLPEVSSSSKIGKASKKSADRQPSSKTTKVQEKEKKDKKASAREPQPPSISGPRKSKPAIQQKLTSSAKTSTKAVSPERVSTEPSDEEHDKPPARDEDSEDEDDMHLHGFSTDDDDSSDEENIVDTGFDINISKLPTVSKDDTVFNQKLEKAKRNPAEDRGVLYLGRLPYGFFEDQLKAYFSQFGTVTRLRLSRNKKTGGSKHYAFIEFDSSSVAQIVAETMDNYLLLGHILRCKVIPKDEVHPDLWIGANRKWRTVPQDRLARVRHNKPRTEEEQIHATKRLLSRQNERKRKLMEAGIKYDFEAVSYKKYKKTNVR